MLLQLDQGLTEMEELHNALDEMYTSSAEAPCTAGPANGEPEPHGSGGACDGGSRHDGRSKLKDIRDKLALQVQLLHLELDRYGGAERFDILSEQAIMNGLITICRLVASTSRGAGSADIGDSDDFPAQAETLRETSLREMTLEEVYRLPAVI